MEINSFLIVECIVATSTSKEIEVEYAIGFPTTDGIRQIEEDIEVSTYVVELVNIMRINP